MLADANVLLILAVVLVAGAASGALAKRFQLPTVTGQILVGILLGPAVVGLVGEHSVHRLEPVIEFALGLMAVAVGSHLSLRRLRVARRRLVFLLALEATLTPLLVFLAVVFVPGTPWQMAALLATLAISTAPATVLALVKETRSKGVFVKTLIAAVALNNLLCICMFELMKTISRAGMTSHEENLLHILVAPVRQVFLSAVVGGGVGYLLVLVTRQVVRSDRLTALSMIAILLTVGLADHMGTSALLSCLFLGISLANLTPDKEEIGHQAFDNFEYAIFAIFFTMAGMELKPSAIVTGGLLATLTFLARGAGKIAAARVGMKIAGATKPVRRWLGPALIPQAGLAVGLMFLVIEDPVFIKFRDTFLAVVLTLVLLNEIVGPILLRLALKKSGDYGQDRARVIDFLHEENITTNLDGPGKEECIRQLVDLAIKTNQLTVSQEELYERVMEREHDSSTCVGEGLALPHARLNVPGIRGVMGINRRGLDLTAPDGEPVHCMVLLITPESEPDRHLEVLSALSRAIGLDRAVQQQLYHAHTPAHAYDLLHVGEESEDFNFFLEEEKV